MAYLIPVLLLVVGSRLLLVRPFATPKTKALGAALLVTQDGDVGCGAGSDDAGDFAADELFAGAGLLDLFADGDFEAGAQESGE